LGRHRQLKQVRQPWEEVWDDICDLVAWRRGKADDHVGNVKRRGLDAYSGVGADALQIWADGMQGNLVSQASSWFRLQVAETWLMDDPQIKLWLQDVEEHLYGVFRRTNFYPAMAEYFYDAGSIGTATMFIEEDLDRGDIVFDVLYPYDVYIAENRRGGVGLLHRELQLDARNAVERFGENNLPEVLVRAAKETPFDKWNFVHCLYPNTDRLPNSSASSNKPFASVYICEKSETTARKSGYDSLPTCTWRTRKNSKETYGRSPAMDAICDIKTVNQISRTLLQSAHYAVEPAYNAPQELKGKLRIRPKGINYYIDHQRVVTPVRTDIKYPIGIDREEKTEALIHKHFRVDFFMMMANAEREMTATEVLERQGEKAVVMGGQIGRLNADCLDPLMDRAFEIERRAGRLPDPPERLLMESSGNIDVDYIGPLAQAQKRLQQTQGINQGLGALVPMIEIYPEARHVINPTKTARRLAEASGFPQDVLRTEEEVEQLIQAERQAAQQQQMAEMAKTGSEAARNMNAPIEEGSPLEAVTGHLVA